jgi:sugar/nucleoside kinase (ribokinase family)
MAKHCHVYGVGAAFVDIEINVSDHNLKKMALGKGLITYANEERQQQLIDYINNHFIYSKRTRGGSTANTIIAIAQFGGRTFYSCKVGNDDSGQFYLNDLQTAGVDYHIDKSQEEGTTGTCLVMLTPDAERTLCTYLGVNEIQSEHDIVSKVIAASDYVYFEAYMVMSLSTLTAVIQIREIAELNNVKIAMRLSNSDIVMRFRDRLCEVLRKPIDLLFCNRNEAFSWTQTDNIEIAIDKLKIIARTFVITLGAEGALVYDGTQLYNIAPHKVHAIDTTGAGDMFAGAFLFGITQGHDYFTAGNLASLASATVVSNYGPCLFAEKQKQLLVQWNNHSGMGVSNHCSSRVESASF